MQRQQEQKERCLCVDGDQPLLQDGIRSVLCRELPGARVIWPEEKRKLNPTILILCIANQEKAWPILQEYRICSPTLRTILLYDSTSAGDIFSYLTMGCCCIYQADLTTRELIECIRMVENNFFLWDRNSMDSLLAEAKIYHRFVECMRNEVSSCVPTQRELEIARGILAGMSNDELARHLYLSTGTVKNKIAGILDKYDFRNRAQIISLLAFK